ncbi:hypothetical protein [Sedimenticola selenatireducens]|uniref:DUF3144 domain-containing protein n=1 Tax=Sedimenticola selenatireducens TaxID=191960 RepID=A0A558E1C7_9GAMM|nr:hypothetical protein [Sedimenticola selenatireducens]TVO79054.1 hypothetical protein FHP88_00380 [Sedimenticola selenatireducens]TVT67154.1 MAG: hypothetical protein FHK78_00015 [Sedimenticola selenatireducens]
MSDSVKSVMENNPSAADLLNAATLRLGGISAMAFQVSNKDFGEWSEGIRANYAHSMKMLADDVADLVEELHKLTKEAQS